MRTIPFTTQAGAAKAIGISPQAISKKLHDGKRRVEGKLRVVKTQDGLRLVNADDVEFESRRRKT